MEKLKITPDQIPGSLYLKTECQNTKEKGVCDKHGHYDNTRTVWGGGSVLLRFCPECKKEEIAERDKKIAAKDKEERIIRYHSLSNIPKRFKSLDINCVDLGYHKLSVDNNKLESTVNTVKGYLETYTERQKKGASGFFSGECGTGKTMLACMMVEEIINQDHFAYYTTAWQMIQNIRQGYKNNVSESIQSIISQYIKKAFLVIDEIGVQHGTEDERILFYQVIDGRYNEVKPTVLISNSKNPVEDGYLDLRTIDRLKEGGGFSITFTGESYRK